MGRPRQISDAQIDDAARETFVEHGPNAPVSLVAAKLGVSHAALLQRAGSKERLLLRALAPGVPAVVQALGEPPPRRALAKRLTELLLELLRSHEQMLPGLMVLRAGGLPISPPQELEPPTLLLRRLLAAWLVRTGRVAQTRAAIVAEGLLGAIEARCFNAHLGGERFVSGTPEAFVDALVRGLVPELVRTKRKHP